jgi:hypothetical protein
MFQCFCKQLFGCEHAEVYNRSYTRTLKKIFTISFSVTVSHSIGSVSVDAVGELKAIRFELFKKKEV